MLQQNSWEMVKNFLPHIKKKKRVPYRLQYFFMFNRVENYGTVLKK